MRIMYIVAFISMILMFVGRHYATYGTEISLRKRKDYRKMDWSAMPGE